MLISTVATLLAHAADTPSVDKTTEFQGLPITIEVQRGKQRLLHDDTGKVVYKQQMYADYGYFTNTKGRDGDEVDVFVGPVKAANEAFVIHMLDKGPVVNEREDEDKCFLGYPSADAAKAAFLAHYPKTFYGGMTALPMDEFKQKLATASLPYRKKKITAAHACAKGGKCMYMVGNPICVKCGKKAIKACENGSVGDTIRHLVKKGYEQDQAVAIAYKECGVKAVKAKTCKFCGGKLGGLLPTDFESAKCLKCGRVNEVGAAAQKPPGLRNKTGVKSCGNCTYYDRNGHCKMYDNFPVKPIQVCDKWVGHLGAQVDDLVKQHDWTKRAGGRTIITKDKENDSPFITKR